MSKINLSPPTREEQKLSIDGYDQLVEMIDTINHQENVPEIVVQESGESIKIPLKVLKLLAEILKNFKEGNAVSIVPVGVLFTTQKAADFLNCSRPHVVKLIESGVLEAEKVGRHRRIPLKALQDYKKKMIKERKEALTELVKQSERLGLYDID